MAYTFEYYSYKTKYVHEYLAAGLAPETVHDFFKQRFRWAAGESVDDMKGKRNN